MLGELLCPYMMQIIIGAIVIKKHKVWAITQMAAAKMSRFHTEHAIWMLVPILGVIIQDYYYAFCKADGMSSNILTSCIKLQPWHDL